MLSIFRTNHIARSLALLLYAGCVRVFSFFMDSPENLSHDGVLMKALAGELSRGSILADVVCILLIFAQAVLINRFVIIHRMANNVTLFPGLFYILFTAFLPSYQYLSAEMVANTCAILLFYQLAATYKLKNTATPLFYAGLLCGIATLVQPLYFFLLPMSVVILSFYNSLNLRRVFQCVVAFLIPLIWYAFWSLWTQSLPFTLYLGLDQWGFLSMGSLAHGTHWLGILALMGFIAWAILSYRFAMSKKILKSRKAVDMMFGMLFFSGLTTLFQNSLDEYNILWSILPLSIILSFRFSDTRYSTLAELGHFLLFVLLLSMNALQYLS